MNYDTLWSVTSDYSSNNFTSDYYIPLIILFYFIILLFYYFIIFIYLILPLIIFYLWLFLQYFAIIPFLIFLIHFNYFPTLQNLRCSRLPNAIPISCVSSPCLAWCLSLLAYAVFTTWLYFLLVLDFMSFHQIASNADLRLQFFCAYLLKIGPNKFQQPPSSQKCEQMRNKVFSIQKSHVCPPMPQWMPFSVPSIFKSWLYLFPQFWIF